MFFSKNKKMDETTKLYYEIMYWMRYNNAWYRTKESTEENSRARRYIELVLNEKCDEEKLTRAVELINMDKNSTPKTKLEKRAKELKYQLDDETKIISDKYWKGSREEADSLCKYKLDKEEVYRVCYKELINELKEDYYTILNTIKKNVNCKHFVEGFNQQIKEKFRKTYGYDTNLRDNCLSIVIADSFFERDPITRELLFEFFVDILYNRVNNVLEKDKVSHFNLMHSLALHTIHFEKYGKTKEKYTSVTDEECEKHILKCPSCVKMIEDHPFKREEYIKSLIEHLKPDYGFDIDFSSFGKRPDVLYWSYKSSKYFLDALTNYCCKEMVKEYSDIKMDNFDNATEIAETIFKYIKNMD